MHQLSKAGVARVQIRRDGDLSRRVHGWIQVAVHEAGRCFVVPVSPEVRSDHFLEQEREIQGSGEGGMGGLRLPPMPDSCRPRVTFLTCELISPE